MGIAQTERSAEFRGHPALDPMQARQLRGLDLRVFIEPQGETLTTMLTKSDNAPQIFNEVSRYCCNGDRENQRPAQHEEGYYARITRGAHPHPRNFRRSVARSSVDKE